MNYFASAALLAALFVRPTSLFPQDFVSVYQYDCGKLGYDSEGCRSYNEMLAKGDKDVQGSFVNRSHTLVCFTPNEDNFFILSFQEPVEIVYKKSAKYDGVLNANGAMFFDRYKEGVLNSSDWLFGQWTKFKLLNGSATFDGKNESQKTYGTINDTEVSYSNTYKNLSGSETTYSVQIRRSTLRFSESWTFPTTAPAKAKESTESDTRVNDKGYCADFTPADRGGAP